MLAGLPVAVLLFLLEGIRIVPVSPEMTLFGMLNVVSAETACLVGNSYASVVITCNVGNSCALSYFERYRGDEIPRKSVAEISESGPPQSRIGGSYDRIV